MFAASYRQRIDDIHQLLGIPSDYEARYGLPLQCEAERLVDAGFDMFGRGQQMAPLAYARWMAMRDAALADDISLLLVSAFRSVDYQRSIIERKLSQGLAMEAILRTSAAPGYSEHHTGNALDLSTIDCEALVSEFDQTDAFRWLSENAGKFGFALSYPMDSASKIIYEPWHWMLKE